MKQFPAWAGRHFLWIPFGFALLAVAFAGGGAFASTGWHLPLLVASFSVVLAFLAHHVHVSGQLALQRQIVEHASEALMLIDREQRILAVNPAFERITGFAAGEALGRSPSALCSVWQGSDIWPGVWSALSAGMHWEGEFWARRKCGEIYPKQMRVLPLDKGPAAGYVAIFSDASGQKAQEARIDYLAHHDPLTGLPNRVALNAYLESTIAQWSGSEEQLTVLMIDLDHFKTINESLGHHAGDRLLAEMARRLVASLDETARLFRLGGDEFVIVQRHRPSLDPVLGLLQRLMPAIRVACSIEGRELHCSSSIGISIYPTDAADAQTLLRHADTAMYVAKANGRDHYQFFAEPMHAAVDQRLRVESELWQALADNQLALHYQPQLDLLTGRVVAVEALVRWIHPQRGMVAPGEFIGVAEECGLILPLGRWVLLAACRQAKAWLDAGFALSGVAVNISAHQFRQADFVESVQHALRESGLPAHCLELEITESTLMHQADRSVQTMAQLKAMGVQLAVDDFGTGYSSLAYLRRFPVDRLKIDRSFVADIGSDSEAESLVASIVALGHSLGLELVAEGVELPAQAEYLQLLECQRVQGFHYARPLAAGELEARSEFKLLRD